MALSHDGSLLAGGDADGAIRIWDITGAEPTTVFTTILDPWFINGLAFSGDDKHLLAVNYDRLIIYSRKGNTFSPVPSGTAVVSDTLATGAISGDATWAVGGSWGGNLYLWRIGDRQPEQIGQIEGSIQKISISSDQRWIGAQSNEGRFGLWQVDSTGTETHRWACPELAQSDIVASAQFDLRTQQLVLGGRHGEDGFVLLCVLAQAQEGTRINIPQDPVRAIAIDDRERALLSGHGSGLIRKWKLGSPGSSVSLTEKPEKEANAGSAILSLGMDSEGRLILAKAPGIASRRSEIEIWSPRSLKQERNLGGIGDLAGASWQSRPFAAISKGSRWLVTSDASSGEFGTIQLTRLQVADLIVAACRLAGRNLTPEEWRTFVSIDESYESTCSN